MKTNPCRNGRVSVRGLAFIFACTGLPWLLLAAPVPTGKPSSYPIWWFERDVLPRSTNVANPTWPTHYPAADDYVLVNQGQLKHVASQAYAELGARLATVGGAGTNLTAIIGGFTTNNNYDLANVGQLKALAKPFYDRLMEVQYTTNYPWSSGTDDYVIANVGQVKNVFSFDLAAPSGAVAEWWQKYYFGSETTNIGPNDDFDGDGWTNLQEYLAGTNPDDVGDHPPGSGEIPDTGNLVELQIYSDIF
jgi:hypothetical protein